jgi:ribonuclease BN (tRNA processing enzyme)
MTPTANTPEGIRVTVLGSGTCVPSLVRSSCSVLMRVGEKQLVFDAGPGTMRRLLEAGTDIYHIDYLLLSHFHPDHSAELVPLLFATQYPDAHRRRKRLTVIGGPGLKHFFESLVAVYGHWIQLAEDKIDFLELEDRPGNAFDEAGFRITVAPMVHNPESLAYRVETPSGASVVYSGDTDYADRLVTLSRRAGLLICESAVPDEEKIPGHLTPALAGRIASEAAVQRLMLTHFYPACDHVDIAAQCRRKYQGPLLLAEDLMTVRVA